MFFLDLFSIYLCFVKCCSFLMVTGQPTCYFLKPVICCDSCETTKIHFRSIFFGGQGIQESRSKGCVPSWFDRNSFLGNLLTTVEEGGGFRRSSRFEGLICSRSMEHLDAPFPSFSPFFFPCPSFFWSSKGMTWLFFWKRRISGLVPSRNSLQVCNNDHVCWSIISGCYM